MQMLRLDFEESGKISRSVENRLLAYLARQLEGKVDAVILSDYAKGVCSPALCHNSRSTWCWSAKRCACGANSVEKNFAARSRSSSNSALIQGEIDAVTGFPLGCSISMGLIS